MFADAVKVYYALTWLIDKELHDWLGGPGLAFADDVIYGRRDHIVRELEEASAKAGSKAPTVDWPDISRPGNRRGANS